MKPRLTTLFIAAVTSCSAIALGAAWLTGEIPPQSVQAQAPAGPAAPSAQVVQGEYITHSVSMCVICHSPRTRSGEIIRGKEFTGGTIPVEALYNPSQPWAERAPDLRTLAAGDPEGVVQLLTTGKRSGRAPRSPMPPFRLSEEDARAVVAYLRTVE